MKDIIKSVILSGCYELRSLLKKIDVFWMQDDLTDEERMELIDLARNHADPENSYADVQKQLETVYTNLAELAARVLALEGRVTTLEGGTVEPPVEEEYPAYRQPTGSHDAYKTGDKMTFTDSKRYICVAPEGVAVVWPPDVMPEYWEVVE